MNKEELERIYGEVLSTTEAVEKYEFVAFCAPFVEGAALKSTTKREPLNFSGNSAILF